MKAAKALLRTVKYHVRDRVGTIRPCKLRLAITSRCNARCSMCDAWRKPLEREMSLKDYERVFNVSASFLSKIKHVSLTGGEPTLRDDLVDVVRLVTRRLPGASVNINTNALLGERVERMTREMLSFRDQMMVIVSLDGLGDVHDKVRGVPGAFERADSAVAALLSLSKEQRPKRLKVEINHTATDESCEQYEPLLNYCAKKGIDLNLIVPMSGVIYRKESDATALGSEKAAELAAVLRRRQSHGYEVKRAIILDVLEGKGRQFDCWAGRLVVFIDADGTVYPNSSCPARLRMGNVLQDGFDLARVFRSEIGTKAIAEARTCRECQVACETGTTLVQPEAWYAYRRASRRV
ncbi:MAG: radical SAM protein [Candidatus Coatesbacteria bacterium]|nr:radical SAM protein [Candidatus Coatesbacteria bacterium]